MGLAQRLSEAWDARERERWIWESYSNRNESHSDWRSEVKRYDEFLRGEWTMEFPDGSVERQRPRIENRVRTFVEDKSKIASQTFPSIRVEAPNQRGSVRAGEREQLIQFYHQLSSTRVKMPLLFADQIGVGMAVLKVWPDFRKPVNERFPLFSRIDPRAVLPPPNFEIGSEPEDIIVHRWHKVRSLKKMYPEKIESLRSARGKSKALSDTDELLVIEYYSDEWVAQVAYRNDGDGDGVTLFAAPNRVGRNPVVLIPRPTPDGRIRGQFNDILASLAAENRLENLKLDYVDRTVHAMILKKGMVGQNVEVGPDAIIDVPEDGAIQFVTPPDMNPGIFRMGADLERHSRRGAVAPEARSGDIQASIISGTAIDALQGPLTTDVHALQQQMEWGLEQANEVAQLVDVTYCDTRKSIRGYAQGGQFRMTYVPSEVIKPDDLSNQVSYGVAAAGGAFNKIVMLQRAQQAGWVDPQTAAIESGLVDNWLQVQNRMDDSVSLDALRQGILARAAQGDLSALARWRQAKEEKVDVISAMDDVIAEFLQPQQTPVPGQPTALPGEAAAGQAIAGLGAEGATGGGGAGTEPLPDLSSLLLG